ncbi:tRNA (guanine(46)-N(7))-methyltransferase TrmB [Bartonella tamiae]|uniref:tRNA (guanine-N(7)-)-methyltransferase n=1 Tax=Bartonella tamiae Th239 TaxID=1094558 RepID=J1K1C4_9HYPH|nr:tRNA (guanine(46)-N(7))-methyltransferase TrmB [Bartonella tamiae]EJF91257.1 tRNA (guanine-N(7)-)-methyltransferase [Bartonella tamiae Th239]EJF93078.1 tRNA (guanine-N(7)-)-methyltransferase [Bartonella tamiae Th307]
MDDRRQRTSEAFYGRRHGKALRDGQKARAIKFMPALKLDLQQAAPMDLTHLFVGSVQSVRLEIGFGGGEHLLHEMARCPNTGFIGVEPFVNGMAKMLAGLEEQDVLQNRIRLYDDDATHVLDWLAPSSLDGIDLFYPDPWPKTKHWKRRFVSQKNLDRFARVLKHGSQFRFASDIESYVNWTLIHCEQNENFSWQAESSKDWQTAFEDWPSTRYEAKAFREGRCPSYLTFLRS